MFPAPTWGSSENCAFSGPSYKGAVVFGGDLRRDPNLENYPSWLFKQGLGFRDLGA